MTEAEKKEKPKEEAKEPVKEDKPVKVARKKTVKKEKKEEKKETPVKEKKKTEKKEEEKKTKKVEAKKAPDSLVLLEKYLEAGVHIGSRFRSGDMRRFIYKCRSDGICVLDVSTLNNRIKIVAKFLSRYDPEKIIVVAGRVYAQKPAQMFAKTIGAKCIIGRFVPGTLTNPDNPKFIEPDVVVISDPLVDRQIVKEAVSAKKPIVSFCDTSNPVKNIDLLIPTNNKGKKSLALIYWLLTREVLKNRGDIKSDKDFKMELEDFETKREERRDRKPSDGDSRFGRRPMQGRRPPGRGRGRR